MTEETITNGQAKHILLSYNKGRFLTVTFVKKNGSLRTMNCRKGVYKGTTGGGLRFDPVDKNLVGVWDRPKGGHRFVTCDDIKRIHIDKKRYVIRG